MSAPHPGAGDPLRAPEAVLQHYRSIDSAPPEYSINRLPRDTNMALMTFIVLSLVVMTAITASADPAAGGPVRDLIFAASDGEQALVPVRVFLMLIATTVACCLATNWWRRLAVGAEMIGALTIVCLVIDLTAYAADRTGVFSPPVVAQQLASSVALLVLFPLTILRHAHLPPAVRQRPSGRIRWHAWLRLVVPLVVAFAAGAWLERAVPVTVRWMRDWSLLGGVGPGIFLVQQVFAVLAAGFGLLMIRRSRRTRFAPAVAVMIPAHNEAHDIGATIAALDRAAARYAAPVHLYVIDNASTDDTAAAARTAIAGCTHCTGEVRACVVPGKAVALNYALSIIREDFVVRIDADTLIGENCLDVTLRHFAKPRVAAVGGMPRPLRGRTFFDRVRLVEVLLKHGFFQVALMGYDGILGEPGMFVVYRRSALDEVGPIVQGMNGEDTDICLRMSSQGYVSLVEPTAVYHSETPHSWAHLREQRIRWFRSIYHVAAHNRHALFKRGSMAGALVLPFQLANAARRAMLLPLLLFGLLLFGVFGEYFPGLHPERLVALVLGLPFLVALLVCLARKPVAVLYLPEYLVFRVVRSYYTLAAVLSLVYPPIHPGELLRDRLRRRDVRRLHRHRRPPSVRERQPASDVA